MSRTETALKPLVANNSSAAHKIASRRLGLRVAAFLLADLWTMICTIVQKIRSGQQYPWALVLMLETLVATVRWQSCPAKIGLASEPRRNKAKRSERTWWV